MYAKIGIVGLYEAKKKILKPIIRIGYVVDFEASFLVLAEQESYFSKANLDVELVSFVGWATLREAFISSSIDVALMPSPMAIEINEGLADQKFSCEVGLVACRSTVKTFFCNDIFDTDVQGRIVIKGDQEGRKYRIGVPASFTVENLLVEHLLKKHYIDANLQFEITCIPASQLFYSFTEGFIDGFCVGQGWAYLASEYKYSLLSGCELSLPEIVLATTPSFAMERYEEWRSTISVAKKALRAVFDKASIDDVAGAIAPLPSMPYSVDQYKDILASQIPNRVCSDDVLTPTPDDQSKLRKAIFEAGLMTNNNFEDQLTTFNPKAYQELA